MRDSGRRERRYISAHSKPQYWKEVGDRFTLKPLCHLGKGGEVVEPSAIYWTNINEPMAGVPKMARGIHCCPNSFNFFLPNQRLYIMKNVCVYNIYIYIYIYTHTKLTVYRFYIYMNYRCYPITLQWNIFTQIGCGAKCWLDIYRWGVGRAVTGRICDIGQNVLESSFQTGSRSSPSYLLSPYRILRPGFC